MATYLRYRPFTIKEFEKILRARIFGADPSIELINGDIVDTSPKEPEHLGPEIRIQAVLGKAIGNSTQLWHNTLRLLNNSRPQPDLVLLKQRDDNYAHKQPIPSDVLLVIEIGGITLNYDRKIKGPIYASAGIQNYWIIDLLEKSVEVCTDPNKGTYENIRRAGRGESVPLPSPLEGTISVDDIFG